MSESSQQMQELKIVDAQGRPRIVLSAKTAEPGITWLREDGQAAASLSISGSGHAALSLNAVAADQPNAVLEIDDKGTHVKFTRKGGASAYLFLNNEGVSGLVLLDKQGKRRFNVLVPEEGPVQVRQIDD